jgi:hypothetical protein
MNDNYMHITKDQLIWAKYCEVVSVIEEIP